MNRISTLLGIRYPIIQGGMVWCSGWRLASAVSNSGGWDLLVPGLCIPKFCVNTFENVGLLPICLSE